MKEDAASTHLCNALWNGPHGYFAKMVLNGLRELSEYCRPELFEGTIRQGPSLNDE